MAQICFNENGLGTAAAHGYVKVHRAYGTQSGKQKPTCSSLECNETQHNR